MNKDNVVLAVMLAVALLCASLFAYMVFLKPDKIFDCSYQGLPTSCEWLKEHPNFTIPGFQGANYATSDSIPQDTKTHVIYLGDLPELPGDTIGTTQTTISTTTSTTTKLGTTTTTTTTTTTLIDNRYRGRVDIKYQKCNPKYDTCIIINQSCCPAYIWEDVRVYLDIPPIKKYYDNGTEYYTSNLTKIYGRKKKCMGGRLDTINSKHYDTYYNKVLKGCTDIGIYTCTPRCVDARNKVTQCVYGICRITNIG